MAVTADQVRANLNNIGEGDLADDAIEQKIATAEFFATQYGLVVGTTAYDQWVLAHASWHSFIISRIYKTKRIDGLEATFAVDRQLDLLKKAFDEITTIVGITTTLAAASTPMFDDRPEDPYLFTPEGDV